MNNIIVVLKDGSEIKLEQWQKLYGLPVGSDKVGMYFSLKDSKLSQDLKEYGRLVINELLIRVLDAFREVVNCPVNINSFNRDQKKQEQLHRDGYRAAVFSPHVVKLAADIDTTSKDMTYNWVKVLKEVSARLGIKIRIGFQDYINNGQTFIHIDVCPEYYAPGKPFNQQSHPAAWEMAITW